MKLRYMYITKLPRGSLRVTNETRPSLKKHEFDKNEIRHKSSHRPTSFTMSSDLPVQIRASLQSQGLPTPSLTWIQSAMPNRNPLPPLPALIATVKTRLLAADLTSPGLWESPSPAFPPNLGNPEVKETKLSRDVPVQVLDIDNLSKSKWDQVEELEAIARGEQTRGREIIRLPTGNEEDEEDGAVSQNALAATGRNAAVNANVANAAAAARNATHRLVIQDCKGQKVHGLELKRIDRIGISSLNIGEKMILKRGTTVARGIVLLEPATCVVLGGKIEAWHRAWVDGRLTRLREAVGADVRS
ncbi:hypothetical protein F4813DRAFT_349806 [Daldinia decipiens]|uniref:uncharacterized protein n=1 Tax=Daldinia decipiens TaxID=326647 RepID=UPI0020C47873|nr:uncharacterized protein F4813DRAFT_349806 [Daldinia decipiens]KAI1660398.1 hypothetical protein F4813DRAFT_349806 [Daldinia decipiens]